MQRITQSAAAKKLGVHKSTVSRWIKTHPSLLGDDRLVDFDQLQQHRDALVNPALQRPAPSDADQLPLSTASGKSTETFRDSKSRREAALADEAERRVADLLGQTMVRADVEAAAAEAYILANRLITEHVRTHADRLCSITEPREMERELRKAIEAVLQVASDGLTAAADAHENVGDAAA